MRRLLFTTLATAALAASAGAQSRAPQPDSIPRELVEALLRPYVGTYPGTSQFVIGHVPAELERFIYVPRDARVLGGLVSQQSTSAIFLVRGAMDKVMGDMASELPKLGWNPPPNDPTGRGWGFVPARNATMNGSGLEYCHIGQSLQITPVPLPEGMLQITASVYNFGGRCATQATFVGGRPPQTLPLPTLVNPMGVVMYTSACNSPIAALGGGNGTAERVQTTLTDAQLLDTFAKQLADSGWTPATTPSVVRRTWTKPDTGRVIRELTVTSTAIPGVGCRDVTMNLRPVLAPSGPTTRSP